MTHFREAFLIALHCMRTGRLRTVLTMLGIVLSISLVISMHGLNAGVQHSYDEALDSVVSPITVASVAAVKSGGNLRRTLTDDDVAALSRDGDPSVIHGVVPMLNGQAGIRRGATVRSAGVLGTCPDDFSATMPMTTARSVLYGARHSISGIGVLTTDMSQVPAAINQIRQILDRQHYIDQAGHRDYSVSVTQNNITTAAGLLTVLDWLTIGLTAIALLIGALGLANIMLITVTDRTPEIGIRKAIGARRGAIFRQFLIEAMLIAGIGGLFGVSLGVGFTVAGQHLLPRYAPLWGVPVISMPAIGIAFGISLLVGLLAGCYPAIRAARLCPMDALRH